MIGLVSKKSAFLRAGVSLLLLVSLAHCGGSSSSAPFSAGASAAASASGGGTGHLDIQVTVGQGGSSYFTSGAATGGGLDCQPYSVLNDLTVTVDVAGDIVDQGAVALGPALSFAPDGTQFLSPVEVSLPVGSQGQGTPNLLVFQRQAAQTQSTVMPTSALVVQADHVTFEVGHFTTFQVGAFPPAPGQNRPPLSFDILTPPDGQSAVLNQSQSTLQFEWQPSVDPDGDPLTYEIIISQDPMLSTIALRLQASAQTSYHATAAMLQGLFAGQSQLLLYWAVEVTDGPHVVRSLSSRSIDVTFRASGLPAVIVDFSEDWKYEDQTLAEPAGWETVAFNDSGWSQGPGLLGYGDFNGTLPATYMKPYKPTYYFRKVVTLPVAPTRDLTATVKYDDGYVLYVNGQVADRHNLSSSPGFWTFASTGDGVRTFTVSASLFQAGTNVIACEMHNRAVYSTDIAFDLRLLSAAASTTITRGPWLVLPLPQSMSIMWETSSPSSSVVAYGETPQLGRFESGPSQVGRHRVKLTGLKPSTRYYYKVISGNAESSVRHFQSPPHANGTAKVVLYGDTRTNAGAHKTVVSSYSTLFDPHVALHSGDLIADGAKESDWRAQWFSVVSGVNDHIPIVPCFGNHEGHRQGKLWDYYPLPAHAPNPRYYFHSFDYGPLHVVIFDNKIGENEYKEGSAQYQLLEADLSACMKPFTMIIFHKPAYSSGLGHGGGENPYVAEDIQPLLEKYGVDFVVCGHDHIYERSFKEGVHHL
ncbi:purple acid phosphatase family protein, partial [Planctomycetota bacterium]